MSVFVWLWFWGVSMVFFLCFIFILGGEGVKGEKGVNDSFVVYLTLSIVCAYFD